MQIGQFLHKKYQNVFYNMVAFCLGLNLLNNYNGLLPGHILHDQTEVKYQMIHYLNDPDYNIESHE